MATITVDSERVFHLILLILSSYLVGRLIEYCFSSFSALSAYALAVTVVCQVNSGLQKVWEVGGISSSLTEKADTDILKATDTSHMITKRYNRKTTKKKNE
jgi:hypothetical protein